LSLNACLPVETSVDAEKFQMANPGVFFSGGTMLFWAAVSFTKAAISVLLKIHQMLQGLEIIQVELQELIIIFNHHNS
jgi:hypothetical protein